MAGVQQPEPWRLLPVALISFSLVNRVHFVSCAPVCPPLLPTSPPSPPLVAARQPNGQCPTTSVTDARSLANDASPRYQSSAASPLAHNSNVEQTCSLCRGNARCSPAQQMCAVRLVHSGLASVDRLKLHLHSGIASATCGQPCAAGMSLVGNYAAYSRCSEFLTG